MLMCGSLRNISRSILIPLKCRLGDDVKSRPGIADVYDDEGEKVMSRAHGSGLK